MANLQTGSLLGYLRGIASPAGAEQANDRELLKRFSNQADESAFATLVHRHGAMVLNVARRILNQKQDAEDVFQAAFLVLARKATRIVWRESIASWLYQVAYRLAQEARAKSTRYRFRERHAAAPSPAGDPLAAISLRETLQILEEELSKLPASVRMPVVLCLLEGEGQQNSALRLGCSLATLKRRLARGRQVLQARLARRGLALAAVLAGVEVSRSATEAATSAMLIGISIRAALAFQSSPAYANAAVGRSVSLAQSMIKGGLLAKFALAGYIAVMCFAGIGLGLLWHQGKGGEGSASAGIEFQPGQGIRQAGDPLPGDLPAGAMARLGTLQLAAGFPGVIRHAPDGKTFLSIDNNRTLRTFDTATGKTLAQRQLPPLKESRGFQAAFSSKMDRLVVRSEAGFDVWDLLKHERLRTLPIDAHMAFRTALSPDDRTFAALEYSGGNGVLRLWDIETGETRVIGEHAGIITGVAFSPDGQRIVTVDPKGTHCWQVATGKALWHNNDRLEDRPVFLPDGSSFLGTVYSKGRIFRLWDALTGKQIESAKLPKTEHYSPILLSPNGQILVLLIQNKGLLFWNLQTGLPGAKVENATNCCGFSPDGKTVIGATGTALARWEVSTGRALYSDTREKGHFGVVTALAFTENGNRLISSSLRDQTMRKWDLASQKPMLQVDAAKIRFDVLAVSPDGKQVAGALEGIRDYGLIRVWDASTGQAIQLLSARSPSNDTERVILSSLRFSPDAKRLTAFGRVDDETMGPTQAVVVSFDVTSGHQLYRRTANVREAAKCVTSDGKHYLSNDGRVFATENGKQILDTRTTFNQAFDSCAFSADESLLAGTISEHYQEETGGGIRMKGIKIWDTASGQVVAEFATAGWFGHLAFTPDTRYLIGTDASAIRVFDTLQNRECLQFANSRHVHDADHLEFFASALCVSPDGRTLASGHADTTILLWDLRRLSHQTSRILDVAQLKEAWSMFASDDARKARAAMYDMALSPTQTLPFLKTKLRPERDSHAERIKELIADLDATEFKKRDSARLELTALNELAEPFIREALNQSPSLEKRRRLELLQSSLHASIPSKEMPLVRGIQVLERIASPEAKQFLRDLADGASAARQTRLAREALERIDR